MKHIVRTSSLLFAATAVALSGCHWGNDTGAISNAWYDAAASQIEYPAESGDTLASTDPSVASPQPWTIATQGTPEYQEISLQEAIQITLSHSRVLRDLGGAVVRSPNTTRSALDPAVAETDPRFGIEAALSEFDAQFLTSTFWEKNDRALNNEFFGGGTRLLSQDAGVFQAAITKRAATGSRFTIRHNVDYDANNAPGNVFASAWNANIEAEIRQPMLRGAGTQYNRIAGLDRRPGIYEGVLIARINTDVALTDFETAVRDLVSNVENAYWDLYAGYRALDARIAARDEALDTWRKVYSLNQVDRVGGEAEKEAQAREQFYRFQQDVQNALSGEPIEMTRNWNGLPGGAFRTTGGVLMAERRLRLLMGMSPTDGRLMRPSEEPVIAKIDFDWEQVKQEATERRSELRRQKWQIRRRELELIASKNALLPQLDGVGRYRWRGFGDDLFDRNDPPLGRFNSAYSDLASGDFQEWQLGFELNVPIGFRQAHSAERNAELLLARERALLQDQQREVVHEVADAIAEMDRAYSVLQTNYNRVLASRDQLAAFRAKESSGENVALDLLLDAQRRVADTSAEYAHNRARYAVAAKNVQFVKGTLLDQNGVFLAEGPWSDKAYHDAAELEARRMSPRPLNYASSMAPVVSRGPFPQGAAQDASMLPEMGDVPMIHEGPQPMGPLPLEQPAGTPPTQLTPQPLPTGNEARRQTPRVSG